MRTFQMINHPKLASPYWLEMAQYLVLLAISNTSLIGVNKALLNKQSQIGRNYQDYKRTLEVLIDEGLILIDDGKLYPGSISDASWIRDGLETGTEAIWELAEKIEPNLKWAKKYDNTELIEIGRKGEEAVVNLLYQKIDERYHNRIRHVALVDDTAGFDIKAPSVKDHEDSVFLEVKTTVRPAQDFTFYISRNEFNVGIKMRNWLIVCVKIRDDYPLILGHLYLNQICDSFPAEVNEQVKWESLKVTVPIHIIKKGLF